VYAITTQTELLYHTYNPIKLMITSYVNSSCKYISNIYKTYG